MPFYFLNKVVFVICAKKFCNLCAKLQPLYEQRQISGRTAERMGRPTEQGV